MKKIILGILVLQLVFLLAGCGDTIVSSDEPEPALAAEPDEGSALPETEIEKPSEPEGEADEDSAQEPRQSGLTLPGENSEDQQVLDPEPEPEYKPEPEEEPEPYVFPEKWTREIIMDFCNKTGRFSDVYNFTMGDTIETVTAELGEETSDPNVRDFYKEYGPELWVFYLYTYKTPEVKVIGVALNRGATYFGLEVGKTTLTEALEQLEVDRWRVRPDADHGFDPGSPSETGDPPILDQKYKEFGFDFDMKDKTTGSTIFYFTDDILETVYVYSWDR